MENKFFDILEELCRDKIVREPSFVRHAKERLYHQSQTNQHILPAGSATEELIPLQYIQR